MLAILGYLMIITFMALLLGKKISPFAGLILVPLIFGIAAALITGVPFLKTFEWVYQGLYYAVGSGGKITTGVAPTITLLLFAILYFSVMLDVGLFDPLAVMMIKWAKGDPMKIMVAAAVITLSVSLDGDGTTTVLIVTASMLVLFKKMKMKQIYLAAIIGFGNSVMNLVPWSGPMARAMPVLNIGPKEFLLPVLPGMVAAALLAIFQAYTYGKKERKRLGYVKGQGILTQSETQSIIDDVTLTNVEYKRPKLIYFNLIMTVAIMVLLVLDIVNGGILFLAGTAIALIVNYRDLSLQNSRLLANGAEALGPVSLVFGAGVIMGVLNGSGMSAAIAHQLVSMIPHSLGGYIPLIFALISLPGLFFLPNDAFYFGLLPVIAPIAYSYGATPVQIGVASLMGQAIRFASPLVAFLYVLVDRTEVSFVEYQKEYLKWGFASFVLQTSIAVLTGAIPI
ncbi:CitMHS family transporter [Streptococcus tangpeifui]|uniref:Citrate transporter n=1 Tax=Streptococcus criceti HS-6 TaxID=873449 RepID=G5JR94_STRCG|nr:MULTISPECIES: citrate:proton symporter [Streptococcus]EHI75444.1 citrate transporter [Streptococcus criceti HS-6]SUN43784.1 CitMHS family citrate/H+ symporter [Streptococcus criceti]